MASEEFVAKISCQLEWLEHLHEMGVIDRHMVTYLIIIGTKVVRTGIVLCLSEHSILWIELFPKMKSTRD